MKTGDKIDLVLTADENGKPAVKLGGESGPDGTLHRVQEGTPIPEDAVLLKARRCPAHPDTLHAEVLHCPKPRHTAGSQKAERVGPAKVSNAKYRNGWDQIFSGKPKKTRQQPN